MMFSFWEDEYGRLQYETPDEVEHTIAYIKNKARKGLLHYISWAFCTPYEGADLYDIAIKHKIISGNEAQKAFEISTMLPEVSPTIMNKYRRKGMLLQFELALRNGNINFTDIKRGLAKIAYILTPNSLLKRFTQS